MKDKTGRPIAVTIEHDRFHDLEGKSGVVLNASGVLVQVKRITYESISGSGSADTTYDLVLVDCSTGDATLTLPSAATAPLKSYRIKKTDSTRHRVVVKPASNENIDGEEDEFIIPFQYDCLHILSDGVDTWHIL